MRSLVTDWSHKPQTSAPDIPAFPAILRLMSLHVIRAVSEAGGSSRLAAVPGAHVEQKNRSRARELVGYLRYDIAAELELLNKIWELDRIFTNYLLPQHKKLIAKVRHGAKVSKTHDRAATPPPHLRQRRTVPGCIDLRQ
jgi:hypothetical protein